MGDNLQQIVDEMRADITASGGGFWKLVSDKLPAPLFIEIIPDGLDCIVIAQCEDRTIHGTGYDTAVPRDKLLSDLYVFVRHLMKEAVSPTLPS
jgi:hypothetical protein